MFMTKLRLAILFIMYAQMPIVLYLLFMKKSVIHDYLDPMLNVYLLSLLFIINKNFIMNAFHGAVFIVFPFFCALTTPYLAENIGFFEQVFHCSPEGDMRIDNLQELFLSLPLWFIFLFLVNIIIFYTIYVFIDVFSSKRPNLNNTPRN